MAKAYSREDIVEAALLRFSLADIDLTKLEPMMYNFYDERGRDDFRKYASVDAERMREYFKWKADNG